MNPGATSGITNPHSKSSPATEDVGEIYQIAIRPRSPSTPSSWAENPARARPAHLPGLHGDDAVHHHVGNSRGVAVGIGVGRLVLDEGRVEHGHVGGVALAQEPAILQ